MYHFHNQTLCLFDGPGPPGDGGVMDLHFSREDMIFRDQARTWLRNNLIRERRPHSGEAMRSFDLAWQRRQFEGGWAGVSWPTEYGGGGVLWLPPICLQ